MENRCWNVERWGNNGDAVGTMVAMRRRRFHHGLPLHRELNTYQLMTQYGVMRFDLVAREMGCCEQPPAPRDGAWRVVPVASCAKSTNLGKSEQHYLEVCLNWRY